MRVLAATNRDPNTAVAEGHLRADLYYRLNVFNIHMPPLRDHMEDLPAMAEAMLGADESEAQPPRLRRGAIHAGPHDGLQLARQCARAAQHHRARRDSVPRRRAARCGPPAARLWPSRSRWPLMPSDASLVPVHVGTTVDEAERMLILRTLEATGQNKTRAAEILGVSLKTLHNKLKEYSRARQDTGRLSHASQDQTRSGHHGAGVYHRRGGFAGLREPAAARRGAAVLRHQPHGGRADPVCACRMRWRPGSGTRRSIPTIRRSCAR